MSAVPCSHYVIRHTDANGDQMWWRADRSGYTSELIAAGVYGHDEARRIERIRTPQDVAILLVEALGGLGERTVGDFLGARQYVRQRSKKVEGA